MQAQREAVSAEKKLEPPAGAWGDDQRTLFSGGGSRRSGAGEAQVRETAREQTAAAQRAVETAATAPERDAAVKALSRTAQTTGSARANAAAALEQARIEALRGIRPATPRRRLTELGQLRRRAGRESHSAIRPETQTKRDSANRPRRPGEAARTGSRTGGGNHRLSFLKVKSGWLQKQVAQGHPEDALWENAQRQNAETATPEPNRPLD
ncbi:MAG: hypothetical protein IPL59_08780 [Candidatus Competibacteraceae bacterium]|nr:hypothetical protein [Candidatus Competibacteraceae bacterium]